MNKIIYEHAPWATLFEKDDFFTRYKHYLQVIVSSDTEERHLRWSGLVESRVRHLVSKLERMDNLMFAHPYIKGFDKVIHYKTAVEKNDAAHGIIHPPADEQTDGMEDSQEPKTMYTSTFYVGLDIAPRDRKLKLPSNKKRTLATRIHTDWTFIILNQREQKRIASWISIGPRMNLWSLSRRGTNTMNKQ